MRSVSILAAAAVAVAAGAALADTASGLAIRDAGLHGKGQLKVTSAAFAAGGAIPVKYTSYGQSISPPVSWSGAPRGTRSVALIIEDPDASTPQPFIHWMIWNIPGSVSGLAEGKLPDGGRQGKLMYVGKVGYFGPRPPAGGAHHYHVQVFALDQAPDAADGAERAALVAAMKGHVLASGETVGVYQNQQ